MKPYFIHLVVSVFVLLSTLSATSMGWAEEAQSDAFVEKSPAARISDLPAWALNALDLARYVEDNKLVVNDDASQRFQARIDAATGEEKLELLYYQVLEATFYVYSDMMKTAKPQYIVEIEKQNSTQHREYLNIMEIFSEFYVGGNSDESVQRLLQIAQNEDLDVKVRLRAYMMVGYAHGVMRETEDIIDVLKQIKTLVGINDVDPVFKTELLEFEGFAYMITNDYAKSMNLMQQRVRMAHELDLMVSGDSYVYHIARIMMERGQTEVIEEINEINRRVAELTGKTRSMFNAAYLCGVNYLKLGMSPEALTCLSRAEDYLASAKDRAPHLDYYLTIAQARMGNASEARRYYEQMKGAPSFEGLRTLQRDLPLAQAELFHIEGNYGEAFRLHRDYMNQLEIRKTNELGEVANKLREFAEEQSTIQSERANLIRLNSNLKDEVIKKQKIVTFVSFVIAFAALLFCLGLMQVAKQLKRARTEAETANKSKSEFLANMSHEIRTPMNGVLGMTEVLLNSNLSSKQRSYANTVYKSGASLMGILNDILDFSKIEAGKMELDPAPFDLEVAVTDVITLMEQTARDKNLKCKTEYSPDLPKKFIGDEGRIRQIITNLISNAIKFTETGHVAIKVKGSQSFTPDKMRLKITIEDTGIGISKEQAEKIFDGFTQAEGSTTRRFGGTGLGLTISRQLVHAMGGHMGVESEIGKGSEFWIELDLPVVESEKDRVSTANQSLPSVLTKSERVSKTRKDASRKIQPTKAVIAKRQMKVLIVDPSDSSVKRLRKFCQQNNMDVLCQKTGVNTLTTLRNAYEADMPFDIVIIDYHLPNTNGAAIAKSISQDKSVGELKVILTSKMDITHYAPRLNKIGISHVLTKPVTETQIMEAVFNSQTEIQLSQLQSIKTLPPQEALKNLLSRQDTLPQMPVDKILSHNSSHKESSVQNSVLHSKSRPSILIVDDNRTNRVVLSSFVDTDLYDVETAEHGKEAWKMSKKTRYDMIFMDISMPVMDGIKATMLIREDEDNLNQNTPIVACTAHALKGDRSRFTSVGMNDYISKPIQKSALSKIMEQWITHNRRAA